MEEDHLFAEKFTEESMKLRKNLTHLREDKKFCDLTLRTVDGKRFRVHKIVLFSLCEYFQAFLGSDWGETKQKPIIDLDPNIDSEAFELILEYIYSGGIKKQNMNIGKAIELLNAASFLRMTGLKTSIEEYLMHSLCLENCLVLWRHDWKQLSRALPSSALDYIKTNCLVFLNCYLLELTQVEIKNILSCDNLNCSQEELLSNLLKWIKDKFMEREIYIPDLIELINFKSISSDFIKKNIIEDEILLENKFITRFILKEMGSRIEMPREIAKEQPRLPRETYFTNFERNPVMIDESSHNEIDINEHKFVKLFNCERRSGFSVTAFRENSYFFTGPAKLCECFTNNIFQKLPLMLEDRSDHQSLSLNGNIYCCGGNDLNSMEIFDLNQMKWLKGPSLFHSPLNLFHYDGNLYALVLEPSGKYIARYESREDKWIVIVLRINPISDYKNYFTKGIAFKDKVYLSQKNSSKVYQVELNRSNYFCEIIKSYTKEDNELWEMPFPYIFRDDLYFLGNNFLKRGYPRFGCYKLNEAKGSFETVFRLNMKLMISSHIL